MSIASDPVNVVPGHDVLALVAVRGGRCTVAELKAAAALTFGGEAVFGNCHGELFDFEALLVFLQRKGKISLSADQVSLGHAPACSGRH